MAIDFKQGFNMKDKHPQITAKLKAIQLSIQPQTKLTNQLTFKDMKTLTVKKSDLCHDLSVFPNFSKSGSIIGMKKKYYGMDALLIKYGNYIYKVTEEIYSFYNQH